MIKLSVNETKRSSLLARTHALILYISIWIFDFGPVKLPGLSRNGPQEPMPPNLTDELSAEKERRLNQFGTPILVWCGKSVKLDSLSSVCQTLLRLHTRCAVWISCRVSVAPKSNLFNTVRHVKSTVSEPGLRRNCPTSSSKIKWSVPYFDRKGDRIYEQLRKMGVSVDWDRACFTMDPVSINNRPLLGCLKTSLSCKRFSSSCHFESIAVNWRVPWYFLLAVAISNSGYIVSAWFLESDTMLGLPKVLIWHFSI